jgi:hypothetical protein
MVREMTRGEGEWGVVFTETPFPNKSPTAASLLVARFATAVAATHRNSFFLILNYRRNDRLLIFPPPTNEHSRLQRHEHCTAELRKTEKQPGPTTPMTSLSQSQSEIQNAEYLARGEAHPLGILRVSHGTDC